MFGHSVKVLLSLKRYRKIDGRQSQRNSGRWIHGRASMTPSDTIAGRRFASSRLGIEHGHERSSGKNKDFFLIESSFSAGRDHRQPIPEFLAPTLCLRQRARQQVASETRESWSCELPWQRQLRRKTVARVAEERLGFFPLPENYRLPTSRGPGLSSELNLWQLSPRESGNGGLQWNYSLPILAAPPALLVKQPSVAGSQNKSY